MNAPGNAPISDRFSSLCARVFSPAAAILESEKTLGTRLGFHVTFAHARFDFLCHVRLLNQYFRQSNESRSLCSGGLLQEGMFSNNHA